jgi:hypothetical protein
MTGGGGRSQIVPTFDDFFPRKWRWPWAKSFRLTQPAQIFFRFFPNRFCLFLTTSLRPCLEFFTFFACFHLCGPLVLIDNQSEKFLKILIFCVDSGKKIFFTSTALTASFGTRFHTFSTLFFTFFTQVPPNSFKYHEKSEKILKSEKKNFIYHPLTGPFLSPKATICWYFDWFFTFFHWSAPNSLIKIRKNLKKFSRC